MSSLTVTLDGLPPSTNKMYSRNWDKTLRLSDDAKSWIDYVTTETRSAANLSGWRIAPRTPWTLHMIVWVPAWTRDADNMCKATIDGIKQAIGCDDRYLVRLLVERESGPARTQLTIGFGE